MLDMKSRWESDVAEKLRENVARDVELNTLRDADATLKAELSQRKHDIDRLLLFCWLWLWFGLVITALSISAMFLFINPG